MKFENLTHINHAFAWPNADGSISAYANFHYPELINKTHEAGKKILVSLGGWGNCGGFSPMAADSAARANFVENIISLFITFDDTASVRMKCEFARSKNLAGVMIWALGLDKINDNQPLLTTVGRTMGLTTHIAELSHEVPESFLLLSNYPNPFNSSTVIQFYLPKQEKVKLEVYNILGERIATLRDGVEFGGWHSVRYDADQLPSGVYLYKLTTAKIFATQIFQLESFLYNFVSC